MTYKVLMLIWMTNLTGGGLTSEIVPKEQCEAVQNRLILTATVWCISLEPNP